MKKMNDIAAIKIAALKANGWTEVYRKQNCVKLFSPSMGGPPCDMVVVHASGRISGPKRDVEMAKFMLRGVTKTQGDERSAQPTGSPRYTATVSLGQWWIEDAHEQRLLTVCMREDDATRIAAALNNKGLCSPAPAGSVSDHSTLSSIRNALNYLVYGAGRKRCPQNVYADAHYGLAMVAKAQKEALNIAGESKASRGEPHAKI